MKIVHFTETFSGGIFTLLVEFTKYQAKKGHQVWVIFVKRDDTPNDYVDYFDNNIKLIELKKFSRNKISSYISSIFQVQQIFHKISPDIIHLHSSFAGIIGRIARLFLISYKGKLVYQPHSISFNMLDISKFKKYVYICTENILCVIPTIMIACSQSEYDSIRKYVKANNVKLIRNGINIIKKPSGIRKKEIILTVGGIRNQKNPELFAQISQALKNEKVEFVWVGDGDKKKRQLLESSGVIVTGFISSDRVIEYLSSSRIYLQTSLWEGLSVALLEGQMLGLPSVVYKSKGNEDVIVDGYNGFVENTLPGFINRIKFLLKNEKEYRIMANNAIEHITTNFNINSTNRSLVQLYEQ